MSRQGNSHSGDVALTIPGSFVEAIAARVAELIGEREPRDLPPWLDVDGAARYLVCGNQRIYDLVHSGALEPARDGRRLLFARADLDAYLRDGAP